MDSQKQNCIDPTAQSGAEPAVATAEPVIKLVENPSTAARSLSVVKGAAEVGSPEDSVGPTPSSSSSSATPPASASVAAPSSSYSSAYAAYNSAHLTVDRSADWPKTRRRQIFNIIYFSICAYLSLMFLNRFGGPFMAVSAVFSVVLLAASSLYLVFHRSHVSVNDELPDWSRKLLRATALLLPFAIIGGTAWVIDHDPSAAWPAPSHAAR